MRASSAVSQQSVPDYSCVSMTTLLLPCSCSRQRRNPVSHSEQLTQLRPLKLGQLCQSLSLASDLLHRLAALETRESRKVGVVLVDQVVVSKRQFGVLGARFLNTSEQLVGGGGAESGGRGHLAQLEVAGGFLVAGGLGATARSLREVCEAGHGCVVTREGWAWRWDAMVVCRVGGAGELRWSVGTCVVAGRGRAVQRFAVAGLEWRGRSREFKGQGTSVKKEERGCS